MKSKRRYKDILTVEENIKGVIDLDTVKGCTLGIKNNPEGCWGLCYAKQIANYRGIDFGVAVTRYIKSKTQLKDIIKTIKNSVLPFIRIGTMGDPCHSWYYTIVVCNLLKKLKPIVIITKHWVALTEKQMARLGEMKVIINTSISPLDTQEQIEYRLEQYRRYKKYGTSILRIVSCDFNLDNPEGKRLAQIQTELFKNENIIDNPLRLNKKYPLYTQGIIKAEMLKDVDVMNFISRFNGSTFLGHCSECPEKCGLIYA